MKRFQLHLLMLLSVVMIVSCNPGYDLACFQPVNGEVHRDSDQLVIFNVSLINTLSQSAVDISIRQAHFVEGTCGYHVYLNIDDLYITFDLGFICTWTLQNTESSEPITTFVSNGLFVSIDPNSEEIPYSLPPSFTGSIFDFYFPHLVAEGRIEGSCISNVDGIINPTSSVLISMEINGCPNGKYGTNCSQPCSCAEGIPCHSFNGVCICPKGLVGNRCDVVDPYVEVDSEHIYIEWGSNLTLECTAHGITNPGPLISWERDGRPLSTTTSRIQADYSPRPLLIVHVIKNMTDALNGEYKCIVEETLVQRVNVTAIGLPGAFLDSPLNQSVVEGQNVTLNCQVHENAGTVKWTRDNQELNDVTALRNTHKIDITFDEMSRISTLTIVMAELSDETSYRCYVGHTFEIGDVNFVEAYVTVVVYPLGGYPVMEGTTNADVFSVRESDLIISITCAVYDVKPTPELTWTLGDQLINEMYQTLQVSEKDGKFTVKNTLNLPAHSGDNLKKVTCLAASDFFGSAEQSIQLNISYAPKIYTEPDNIDISEGGKLTANCLGSSNPTPITYRWECSKSNGDVIHQEGQTFSVPDASSDFDQANLRCIASNSIGTSSAELKAINIRGSGLPLEIILPVSAFFLFSLMLVIPVLVYLRKKKPTIPHVIPEQNKEFDVFISYKGDTDEEAFVAGRLVPKLEEFGYRVCVHYKHFIGGNTIIENINECISKSRMTMIVLSRDFVESRWCKFEFKSASTKMPNFEKNVIPVMFDDVTQLPNLDQTLKDLLERVGYIKWPRSCQEDDAREKKFWKLVRKALRPSINSESVV